MVNNETHLTFYSIEFAHMKTRGWVCTFGDHVHVYWATLPIEHMCSHGGIDALSLLIFKEISKDYY